MLLKIKNSNIKYYLPPPPNQLINHAQEHAPAGNHTRGLTMKTLDFANSPLVLIVYQLLVHLTIRAICILDTTLESRFLLMYNFFVVIPIIIPRNH